MEATEGASRRWAAGGGIHVRRSRVDGADHPANQLGLEDVTLSICRPSSTTSKLTRRRRHDFQWTYYGGDEIFSRVGPTAFAPATTAPGTSGLCVEFTCRKDDERWNDPDRSPAIIDDLLRTKTIDRADILKRISNACP